MPVTAVTPQHITGYDCSAPERLKELLTEATKADLAADQLQGEARAEAFARKYWCLGQALEEFPSNFLVARRRSRYEIASLVGYPNPVGAPRYLMHVPVHAVAESTSFADFGAYLRSVVDLELRLPDKIANVCHWPDDKGVPRRPARPRLATHQVRRPQHRVPAPARS